MAKKLLEFNDKQIQLIKAEILKPKDRAPTQQELDLFINYCETTGLNPFLKQVHAVFRSAFSHKENNKPIYKELMSIQTGIDGLRLIAERSGNYAGNDSVKYKVKDGSKQLELAEFTVYKIVHGVRCAVNATAFWDEYCPISNNGTISPMWVKMPHNQLAKCAEALALRRGWPMELSGVYIDEEMEAMHTHNETASEINEKWEGFDPAKAENLVNEIKSELEKKTLGMDLPSKGKIMMETLKVRSFEEVKRKALPELEKMLAACIALPNPTPKIGGGK